MNGMLQLWNLPMPKIILTLLNISNSFESADQNRVSFIELRRLCEVTIQTTIQKGPFES